MGRLKTATLTLTLAGACGYSLFQKLQWPAVLSLALLVALLCRQHTLRIIEACLAILNSAKVAKFGQVEFQSDRQTVDASKMTLRELMLADLSPRDVNVLLTVYHAKHWSPPGGSVRDRLRELRNRGWLAYDRPTLRKSKEVWLTPSGLAVAEAITPNLQPALDVISTKVRGASAPIDSVQCATTGEHRQVG